MKFGLCCGLDQAEAALQAGFDYVELPASQLMANEDAYARFGPEATNLFFPSGAILFGPDATPYREYAENLFAAADRVGVRTMVVGSGAARKCPESMAITEAEAAFYRVVAELDEMASVFDITVAPESLNQRETNVCNDLGIMALALADLGLNYTADSFHAVIEWFLAGHERPPDADYWRQQLPVKPAHVHLGDRQRLDPDPADPDLRGFVARLRELGYEGRISLECSRRSNEGFPEALQRAKSLFAQTM